MIETMIEFRPRQWWPKRCLERDQAEDQARAVWGALIDAELIQPPGDATAHAAILAEAVDAGLMRFDAILREVCFQHIQQFFRSMSADLGGSLIGEVGRLLNRRGELDRKLLPAEIAAIQQGLPRDEIERLAWGPSRQSVEALASATIRQVEKNGQLRSSTNRAAAALDQRAIDKIYAAVQSNYESSWDEFLPKLNAEIFRRAAGLWTRIVSEELIARTEVRDTRLADVLRQAYRARYAAPKPHDAEGHHHGLAPLSELPLIDPHPAFDSVLQRLTADFSRSLLLWPHDPQSLAAAGGEMDRALQMPGWTNVWTRPIQNRVDMLATGVNAEVGVRVLGRDLDVVVRASEEIATVLRSLPGAADVVADPIRGKGYLHIDADPDRAAALGVSLAELNGIIESALSGRIVAHDLHGRERLPVRLRVAADNSASAESLRRLPVPVRLPAEHAPGSPLLESVPLDTVAEIQVTDGPATIKSENGWLRNYVRLNVRGRDPIEFVEEARRVIAAQIELPPGVFVEWTGQFEHSVQARRKLLILAPLVLGLIVLILYVTYRDWADALLMLLAVPGALAGGVLCQWLLGYPFSIAVGMGYIACFGMAAATSIVMLVYLREAVERAGGLQRISAGELRRAVLDGAVHRLRPKLLTEATTMLGLAPMLWSTGVGSEVIRPMAAPVLGGILVADEVIDLLLPVLFYRVRLWRWKRLHGRAQAEDLSPRGEPQLVQHSL
jgi:Cu(I)/Ag(I) efflux system membrane protein CusA/SilA